MSSSRAPSRASRMVARAILVTTDLVVLVGTLAAVGTSSPAGWSYLAAVVAVLAVCRAYRPRITLRALEEAPRLVRLVLTPLLALGVVNWVYPIPSSVLVQALASAAALIVGRSLAYLGIRRLLSTGRLAEPTLILGGGKLGVELAQLLRTHPEYGLVPVGFLDSAPAPDAHPYLGDVANLHGVLRTHDVRHLVVAFGPTREHDLVQVLRTAVLHDVEVHVVPRFFEIGLAVGGPDVDDVWGIPLHRVRPAAVQTPAWKVKRAADVAAAAAALVVAAPLLVLIALAVRLSSPGPVLFRQKRLGQHRRVIELLKFRTLAVNDEADTKWTVDHEVPYTPVGAWLRRTGLDELPQLWNVLRGDMSLVGPRPERPYFVEEFASTVPGYIDRLRLPAGLTGWAQVHGLRGDTSIVERARFDNRYIEDWSLWREFVILVRTIPQLFRGVELASIGLRAERWKGRPRPLNAGVAAARALVSVAAAACMHRSGAVDAATPSSPDVRDHGEAGADDALGPGPAPGQPAA